MEQNYVVYHLHDDKGSLLDSCTKWEDYVDLAASYGMKAIASTNHGYNLNSSLVVRCILLLRYITIQRFQTRFMNLIRDGTRRKHKRKSVK